MNGLHRECESIELSLSLSGYVVFALRRSPHYIMETDNRAYPSFIVTSHFLEICGNVRRLATQRQVAFNQYQGQWPFDFEIFDLD